MPTVTRFPVEGRLRFLDESRLVADGDGAAYLVSL